MAKIIFVTGVVIAALVFAFSSEARQLSHLYRLTPVHKAPLAGVEASLLFSAVLIDHRRQRPGNLIR